MNQPIAFTAFNDPGIFFLTPFSVMVLPASLTSNAIALALRADCPIYVDMEVIKASQNKLPAEDVEETELSATEEEWPDVIGEAGDLPM